MSAPKNKTLVFQSHKQPLPYSWLSRCLDSVKSWAKNCNYDYRYLRDELFEPIDKSLLEKTTGQTVIATDLARLKWIQKFLADGYQTVVWCDADFLIFAPQKFSLPTEAELPEGYAVGRETWVQADDKQVNKLKIYKKVHNAFMVFRQGNAFLDFYCAHAERLLAKTTGTMPPQFIGPKLLTAIHNVVQCPVVESAAMFSPLVIKDIIAGGGPALSLLKARWQQPAYAANLCISMAERGELSDGEMYAVIDRLLIDWPNHAYGTAHETDGK
ncbi:hypothetical protein QSV34_05285 [Porticoccus sp. W117]|uniref:hypothetical protein n=1 Tax=Porticoccus sp. W117 TaxID=3054777 RepID=UPI00259918D8|nr:hypothetical protein [Porticoccus sp. W117]MDM3870762.1 hypothetical protein [Porticoccus sp. W117]